MAARIAAAYTAAMPALPAANPRHARIRRQSRAARAALAVAAAMLAASACAPSEAPRVRNVVLVSVDTLRADRVGLCGATRPTTPRIDAWFRSRGRTWTRSWSAEASTTPSVVSMLSGRVPEDHRVRMLVQLVPRELALLPDLLPPDWKSAGFVSNMMLTEEASGLASHFDHYDDFVDEAERHRGDTFERNAQRTTDAVLHWLDDGRPATRVRAAGPGTPSSPAPTKGAAPDAEDAPLFLWVHYMDPHGPYHAPDSWPRTFRHEQPLPIDPMKILPFQREPGMNDGLAYVDAYDEEVAYTDSEVGRLLEGLDARLDPANTLVVFTADHGESLMDHDLWFRHAVQVYEEMVRVPLLLKGPGVVPGTTDLPASGIDLAPTILSAIGVPVPPTMGNVDLRNGKGITPERVVFTEASLGARDGDKQWRAAIHGDAKWVLGVKRGDCAVVQQHFDLRADPHDASPLPWDDRDAVAAQLLDRCRNDPDPAGIPTAWSFGKGLKGPKSPPMSGEDQLRSLKALGYAQ